MRQATLLETPKFDVVEIDVEAPGGETHRRAVIRHPGAAVILPILSDGRVVLIRNVRHAVGRALIELPAGTLDPGEAPIATAARELAEETGYRAGKLEPLLSFYATPGICDERMHAFVATELADGPTELEATEAITLLPTRVDDAVAMIRAGQIEDGKTIAALLYWTFVRGEAG